MRLPLRRDPLEEIGRFPPIRFGFGAIGVVLRLIQEAVVVVDDFVTGRLSS